MVIKPEFKNKLSSLIKNIEAKSSAEVICVITKSTLNTKFTCFLVSLAIAALCGFFSIFLNLSSVFYIFGVVLCGVFLILQIFPAIFRIILPEKFINKILYKFALKNFNSLGFNEINSKQVLMFFVSLSEKYICVITKESLNKENGKLENIIKEFIQTAKNGNLEIGIIKALRDCGDVLIQSFPVKKDDVNEIEKEVIELD
ncbi:DUF1420 family protein [Campylobacter sp. 19-13652]|uniref:DUF1420 family protein n=1 Tax=Campylobacter sp. 19-13652 TaxID=2840180 RepID=UPI001C76655D|nr:DUF1420 family protein [Campylobacter sp. 19-13652]BCX80052.1 hypothetical protein LBC_15140 [Campylobacter sp. 19-13652]